MLGKPKGSVNLALHSNIRTAPGFRRSERRLRSREAQTGRETQAAKRLLVGMGKTT